MTAAEIRSARAEAARCLGQIDHDPYKCPPKQRRRMGCQCGIGELRATLRRLITELSRAALRPHRRAA